jgi:hypothetical protein
MGMPGRFFEIVLKWILMLRRRPAAGLAPELFPEICHYAFRQRRGITVALRGLKGRLTDCPVDD